MAILDMKMTRVRSPRSFTVHALRKRMKKGKIRKSVLALPQKSTTSSSSDSNFSSVVASSSSATSINADEETQLGSIDQKLAKAAEEGDIDCFMNVLKEGCSQLAWLPDAIVKRRVSKNKNTYVHVATRFGRFKLIDLLLTDYRSVKWLEKTNNEGDSAFHIAAKVGHFGVMDLLIRHGKLLSTDYLLELKNKKGNTALHEALLNKHHHLVDLLLHTNARCSCYLNNEKKSPFYLSVEAGNENTFNAMLKAVCQTSSDRDDLFEQNLMKGRSPLQAAILRKDKVMLQEILAKGMHMLVHVKDDNGEDPVQVATRIGFEEGKVILDEELKCGVVSADSGDADGAAALFVDADDPVTTARDNRMRVLLGKVMLTQKQQDMCHHHCMEVGLYKAVKRGDIDEFISALEKYLEEKQLDLPTIFSQLTPLQNTFLHVASTYNKTDIARLIFKFFPNLISKVNSHGNTAFHLAAQNGHLNLIEMIVKLKNDKLVKDLEANNNSDVSAATYFINSMQTLVENNDGRTPLQLSHKHRQGTVMEFLIRNNVEEAYYVNKNGTSLLYTAIINSDIGLLKTIYDTVSPHIGQNLQNVLDKQLIKGKSLLFGAIWSQNIEILQELATKKTVLLKVKYEHAQKLMHFAEFLGFHQGANYLRSKISLVPETPVQSYSLDEYSLSVIDKVDPEINSIRRSMVLNKRHERMVTLLSKNSPPDTPRDKFMDTKLYEAAKKGDVDSFIGALVKVSQADNSSLRTISEQRTHSKNTCLHVAASHGNKHLTGFIVFYFRNLLFMTNSEGNTANHEAARAGHLGVVKILVRFKNYDEQMYSAKECDTTESSPRSKEWVKNYVGNTSMHEAFLSNQNKVVKYLTESSVEEAYILNKEGKSGLYLAVEANMVDVVKTILSNMTLDAKERFISESKNGKVLINAAIKRKSTVMLQEITRNIPSQIHATDKVGQTPLSCAVSTGFLNGVNCLLYEFNMDSSLMDSSGSYPVHAASKSGHVQILEKLLNSFPDSGRFVNGKGQNILHVAAENGKDRVVSFILKTKDLGFLINKTDEDGNTPLHLAAIKWHPKVVSCLTWDRRVNLNLVNRCWFTALDAAEESMKPITTFQQRLTWSALMSAGAKRSWYTDTTVTGKSEQYKKDYSKDRVNTLMLVAVLIATVTFAAGFTMPGGYNNSPPNEGHATLLHKHMLQTFLICDTIALFSAIMVSVTLIWAQLGDITLVINALTFALPLLGLSLTTMSIAFMAGVSLVVVNLTWLVNFVFIFGIICIASVLALFIPLLFSYSSTSKILRYITYYPFQLLVLASAFRSSDDRHIKED